MRSKRIGMEVSIAGAEAVRLARAECIAAYPITPQTHIVEHLSELVAEGQLDAEFIPVESEHSALSVCAGTSAVGARTFTATSSQGLALMHEILFIVSGMRLPIVMAVANRALSAPLNIWNDHSDVMASRDCGWIQVFTENGQEVFDHTLCTFKIAEHPQVLLPAIINLDGFTLSHVVEPMELVSQEVVDSFLPPFQPPYTLHPDRPLTMGAFAMPEVYTESRKALDMALRNSFPTILRVWEEWGELTGRHYRPLETYRMEGARVALLTMGSFSELAMVAVDRLREKGVPAGLLKLRLWRPFPLDEIRQAVRGLENLVVLDRALSVGGMGGPVCAEVQSALYRQSRRPRIFSFIAGLGGRDVPPEQFEEMVQYALRRKGKKQGEEFITLGVRE
ncbi:MAG: pyruvate ferredoxin oxidoreductase [Deltaproteobacteria bacterium]|nr:pyruvate ferredoxin oxidoreductase [Deltaproteobacteria bacterium]